MNRKYTYEHIDFLRKNVKGRSYVILTELFNRHFGTKLPVSSVKSTCFRYGLRNGVIGKNKETQFAKGHKPWNKGIVGLHMSPKTEFKKGNKPWNYRPINSERVTKDGYIEIKIAGPNRWKLKHIVIWEETYGTVPKNNVIIFADGNKKNINIENLILVSRKELAILNKHKLIAKNSELTKIGVNVADVILKIGEIRKGMKNNLTKKPASVGAQDGQ